MSALKFSRAELVQIDKRAKYRDGFSVRDLARYAARLQSCLRQRRAFLRMVASCKFGSKLRDDDYRQRMYRTAEEEARRIDRALGTRARRGR